jgi:transcriptional regulator with XRE-family HTH domain
MVCARISTGQARTPSRSTGALANEFSDTGNLFGQLSKWAHTAGVRAVQGDGGMNSPCEIMSSLAGGKGVCRVVGAPPRHPALAVAEAGAELGSGPLSGLPGDGDEDKLRTQDARLERRTLAERMTSAEVLCARESLGLTQSDLARLLGNNADTIRDWERGKTFTPVPLAAQIAEVEALLEEATEHAVTVLVAELRAMPRPRAVVYGEGARPQQGDVARFGVRWWRGVASKAKAQVPGTRIGTQADFDAIDSEL